MRSRLPSPLALMAFLGVCPLLSGCYVVQQGLGQLALLQRREPVDAVLARAETPARTRASLHLVQAARAYAERHLGLQATRNYETFVQLDRDAVTYVVSAAPRDSLKPYEWWFPIVGKVPYKGFFARSDAEAEQARLDAEGLDTALRGVSAFSLLGWLPDPIYSPFLAFEPATLVNVVIHETTHATVFLSGQAAFNEGFATFVGNEGAAAFFHARGGGRDPDYRAAQAARHDAKLFTAFIEEVAGDLERLYASGLPPEVLSSRRERAFAAARRQFESAYRPRLRGHQFRHFGEGRFNNATLAGYRTYYQRLDRFENAHARLGHDLARTVAFFRDTVARAPDPSAFLDDWLARPPKGSGPGVEGGSGPAGSASPSR